MRVDHRERIGAVAVVDAGHRGRVALGNLGLAHGVLDGLAVRVGGQARPAGGPAVRFIEHLVLSALDRHRLSIGVHVAQLRRHRSGTQAVDVILVVPHLRHVDIDRLQLMGIGQREGIGAVHHAAGNRCRVALGHVRLLHGVGGLVAVGIAHRKVVPGKRPVIGLGKLHRLARDRNLVALRVDLVQLRRHGIRAHVVGVAAVGPHLRHADARALLGGVRKSERIGAVGRLRHARRVAGGYVGFLHGVLHVTAGVLRGQIVPRGRPAMGLIERCRVAGHSARLTRDRAIQLRGDGRMHAGLRIARGILPFLMRAHRSSRRGVRVHQGEAVGGAAHHRGGIALGNVGFRDRVLDGLAVGDSGQVGPLMSPRVLGAQLRLGHNFAVS